MVTKEEIANARANLARFLQQASALGDDAYSDIEEVIKSITDEDLATEIDTRNATDVESATAKEQKE